ncbi:MAG: hypothetical protein ABSC63_13985 [Candidatus Binataceae bacterium]
MNRRIERARSRRQAKALGNSPVITLYDRDREIGETPRKQVIEAPSRRRAGDCRCGKKMKNTTTPEDVAKWPGRIWLECVSCGTKAHRDKRKRTEWFPPSTFRGKPQSLAITAPPEKSHTTNYRVKHPRPGGPHSSKTY